MIFSNLAEMTEEVLLDDWVYTTAYPLDPDLLRNWYQSNSDDDSVKSRHLQAYALNIGLPLHSTENVDAIYDQVTEYLEWSQSQNEDDEVTCSQNVLMLIFF